AIDSGEASARRSRRILTIGMGNPNRRRAIGAARAAVRDDGGCLSRAARKRFTADGLLAGTNERPLCLPIGANRTRQDGGNDVNDPPAVIGTHSQNERYGMWAEARRYSALMLAALMIGHHLSISALWWA